LFAAVTLFEMSETGNAGEAAKLGGWETQQDGGAVLFDLIVEIYIHT